MKEIVITSNEAGQRFDKFLKKYLKEMPLSGIYKSIRKKQITVNGNKASEKYILNEGDIVKFNMEIDDVKKEQNMDFLDVSYDFSIIYEDENLLIVNKKPGILVHPDEGREATLTHEVLSYLYDKGRYIPSEEKTFTPSPCNRLDRNTEGLVIFAKNYEALKAVNESIREGGIEKYYTTMVKGRLADGTYRGYIVKNPKTNKVTIHNEYVKNGKEIVTRVINNESIGIFSHIDIELITGRSHQIRAHLASMGNPLVGDPKYGDNKTNSFFFNKYGIDSQMLIAYKLTFKNCPGKIKYLEGKTIAMPIPQLFKKIKKDLFKF